VRDEAPPRQEEPMMEPHTWRLRVSATERGQATVFTRQHRFRVGAPVHFDQSYEAVSALEYVLGAIGADLVNGLQASARKRRMTIEQAEAVVEGELNNPLTYLGVVGETGHPGLERVRIKVYLASPEPEEVIRHLWQEMLATSPLVCTFRAAIQLELTLQVVA
jgi:OsmC-like protein